MLESGFEAKAHSSAGAAGLWQFTPDTARLYGLTIDHWIDQRLDPRAATDAAVELLGDLHQRFGAWELALAAYDMGWAGLASVVRRYNTNDFWSLSRTEGTLPWETTLYVPKIIAAAVVASNLAAFGFADVAIDEPVRVEDVETPPGTPLPLVAQAAGCTAKELQALNPELRVGRTPPAAAGGDPGGYMVKVPRGKGAAASQALAKLRREPSVVERYVMRFGETLEQVATAHKTTVQHLIELNGIAPGETRWGGTVLLVPKVDPSSAAPNSPASGSPPAAAGVGPRPTVIVPADVFVYPDRRRVLVERSRPDRAPAGGHDSASIRRHGCRLVANSGGPGKRGIRSSGRLGGVLRRARARQGLSPADGDREGRRIARDHRQALRHFAAHHGAH
jgi:membrane-bound lytic murein transglycosylase D